MDLDLVRHALAAARRHGYAEVELGEGEASFTARLARLPKAKAASAVTAAPVEDVPKPIKATLVGYWREAKEPLAVGRTLRRDDVVGMVEALGIVTDVIGKVEGEVVEVLVVPGQAVEYGQILARVKGVRRERGQTLVGLVIVIAIMAILAVAVMRPWAVGGTARPARADGLGNSVPGLAKLKADDTVCASNLSQVRQFIMIARTNGDDQPPASLKEIQGLPKEFLSCPIGHEPYQYDPATGTVRCVHPGHEKY